MSKCISLILIVIMVFSMGCVALAAEEKGAGGYLVVVLDPGHGGSDSGATYNGLLEKDVNLRVASVCKAELEQYAGVKVYMTRYDDTYVGLEERVNIAQSLAADVFISIHMNSGGGNGVEVWYPNANYRPDISDIGYKLSGSILKNIVSLGMRDRGLKIRNSSSGSTYPDGSVADYYSVIHNSKRRGFPGIIVEHGFIDGDYSKLSDDNFLYQLGLADAKGIAQYYGLGQENLAQYEGAFDADFYRFFNSDLWQADDYQCFLHWVDVGAFQGMDGSPVFNLINYMNSNPDLVSVFGFDVRQYARHFSEYGMNEGRISSNIYNIWSYKNRYRDLREAFGNDVRKYYMHYINFGFAEGRETIGYDDRLVGGGVSNIWIFDFSDVYDYDYYRGNNSDLRSVFGVNDTALIEHFNNNGMAEGRQASERFNVWAYAGNYEDLQHAFGWDMRSYYIHYMQYGKYEGRRAY